MTSSGMAGKVVVITGATSGIGQAAAESLAGQGARIVQIARNKEHGAAALKRLNELAPEGGHSIHYGDLSLVEETKRVGLAIASAEPRIDVLINNAGAIFGSFGLTKEGIERTLALNHLSYFVLTRCLLERLLASAPARIVNTASDAHQSGTLDFDDLESRTAYQTGIGELLRYGGGAYKVYARSKLCNVLFTRELARQVAGTRVTANSLHPGFVATNFASHAGGLIAFSMGIAKYFARPVAKGAETVVYLVSAPEAGAFNGEYFVDCRVARVSAAALDDKAARRLWEVSEKLAG